MTAGPLPCTGSGTITLTDSGGAGEIKGSFTLPTSHVSATADLTLSDAGNIGGTATVTENGQTLTLTGLTGTIDGPITGSVTVAPDGDTGTATLNIAAGTFTVTLHTPTAHGHGLQRRSGNLNITLPSGTTETVSSPLTASPTGTYTTTTGTGVAAPGAAAARPRTTLTRVNSASPAPECLRTPWAWPSINPARHSSPATSWAP